MHQAVPVSRAKYKGYPVLASLLLFVGMSFNNVLQTSSFKGYYARQQTSQANSKRQLTGEADRTYHLHQNSNTTRPAGASYCSREALQSGSWVPVQHKRPPYISKTQHLRCYPLENYKSGVWNTHEWQPDSDCQFRRWDRHQFCTLMKHSTILIIGDSLSWEHYSSLGQLLGERIHQTYQHESKQNGQNHVQLACQGKVRMVFRRDDILTNISHAIQGAFPQVIVMNRGAHYQNDTRLISGIRRNIEEIRLWKAQCQEANLKCHLFWRTSVPGHPQCDKANFTAPVNDLERMEAWIANRSNYDNHTINYHWYDYQHQNEMVLQELTQALGSDSFEVLDAYHLNILRPDEHRAHQGDCLHNCYPGKMDVYSQLLYHFLKQQRSKQDADELKEALTELALVAGNGQSQ